MYSLTLDTVENYRILLLDVQCVLAITQTVPSWSFHIWYFSIFSLLGPGWQPLLTWKDVWIQFITRWDKWVKKIALKSNWLQCSNKRTTKWSAPQSAHLAHQLMGLYKRSPVKSQDGPLRLGPIPNRLTYFCCSEQN